MCEFVPEDDPNPCAGCQREALSRAMSGPAGRLVRAGFELQFDLAERVTRRIDEIPADEFRVFRVIRQEQERLKEENAGPGNHV